MFTHPSDQPMYNRYKKAIENNDMKELEWFAQFGNPNRLHQLISNAKCYEQYLACGYTDNPHLNDYGWLENGSVKDLQEQFEEVQMEKNATVILLQFPNGKWVSSVKCQTSLSGIYSSPGIWTQKQFCTRQEALDGGIDRLIHFFTENAKSADKGIIERLKKAKMQTRQTSFFDVMFEAA